MLANVLSAAIVGVEAHLVDVEVDISSGLPQFSIVGLPDATVRESRDRVRAALKNSGFHFPVKKITVNLAPANIKKEGAGLDLAIALGILAAEEIIPTDASQESCVCGRAVSRWPIETDSWRPLHRRRLSPSSSRADFGGKC